MLLLYCPQGVPAPPGSYRGRAVPMVIGTRTLKIDKDEK